MWKSDFCQIWNSNCNLVKFFINIKYSEEFKKDLTKIGRRPKEQGDVQHQPGQDNAHLKEQFALVEACDYIGASV